jgi:hypothetical protein
LRLNTKFVQLVPGCVIVGCEDDNVARLNEVLGTGKRHDVRSNRCDIYVGVPILQNFGDRFDLPSPYKTSTTNMPDYIFRAYHITVDEGEIAESRHHQLQRNATAP